MIAFLFAVASLVVLSLLLLLLPFNLPKLWRGDTRFGRSVPAWWRYGSTAWKGYIRMIPVTAGLGGPGLALAAWCLMLLSSTNGRPFVSDAAARSWLEVGAVIGAGIALVAAGLGLSIFLFNTLRIFVAPHLRRKGSYKHMAQQTTTHSAMSNA